MQTLLKVGAELGSFEITALLGKGGMGEVYRARDSKLKREVAIKILPDEFSRDPERVSRFQREAEVLASINHPNIAAIHDLQEAGGFRFLVLELVEGETLAERIGGEPVPVVEALGIARQICEALEAAHEKGIVHRDLKPANIKVTPEGKVKVLDFGLAKAFQEQQETNLSNSPTLMSGASIPGVILGTAAYMSPEQARGRKIDRRTDVFAFGCVLYEMLTAKRVFDGEDVADTLSRVLQREPDWTILPVSVPPRIKELLRLCLEKNVKNRRDSAADVRLDIDEALRAPETVLPSATPRRRRFVAVFMVTIVALTLLLGMGIESRLKNTGETATLPIQFSFSAPSGLSLMSPPDVAVSPDGRWLSFTTLGGAVWLRPIDSTEARQLAGADGSDMFWSPDSKQLAFFADRKIKVTEVLTGFTRVLTDVPSGNGNGGSWNQDGVILFGCLTGIYKVASGGGIPSRVDVKDGAEPASRRQTPRFLPDGEHFLYVAPKVKDVLLGSIQEDSVQVASMRSLEAKPLLTMASAAQYVPPGYLIFVKGAILWAQSFDSAKLSLSGEPQAVAQPIYGSVDGSFLASQNGVLIFNPGVEDSELLWVDKTGKETGKLKKPATGSYANPAIAPDGRRVAVNSVDPGTGKADIWLVDSARDVAELFTLGSGSNKDPIWSPDGEQIAFRSNRENHFGIYVKSVAGAAAEQIVSEAPANPIPVDWSPDGKFIVYSAGDGKADRLWLLSLPDHKSTRLLPTVESAQYTAKFSHDGKWIAYASDESGKYEVYIQDFPVLTQRHKISDDGGAHPRWGKDDAEIYYQDFKNALKVAELRRSGTDLVPAEAPRVAFDRPLPTVMDGRNQYTISADGERFLVLQLTTGASTPSLTVMVNWLATLHK